jgi:hypothetical protein
VTLQDRVRKYTERAFQRAEAEILVLIEESAVAIFAAFPEHFIVFGGATLVLFYDSPRFSRDLDLLASPAKLPASEEILGIVRARIQPVAETFGLARFCHDRCLKNLQKKSSSQSGTRCGPCFHPG